ncbi:DUF1376 domain-containing protein [Shinella kummerowiae]|uniref:DUF1376 domain-containing protein n=1 Tax=Shinella kummerowiae TaxID=417745 RepID=A0A6N8SI83_9HYPH|nr:DUF1376 domain-containing protein [Shinella kummerowiae]MXN48795.1 DUF1376 domain-containing protein [Shinella kummerowiae]
MTHLPWMPVYVGDELAETSHLNAEEYGAYALLKMHMWQHGRLPSDDERLARIAKCAAERWDFVKEAIWTLFADDWRHPRLETLRAQSEETHKKRSEAGRRGGRPRLEEKPGLSRDKAGPKHPQPQPQPQSDSYSDPEAQAQSQSSAAEKDQGGTYTRALPVPHSIDEGKLFLLSRGCPPEEMKRCLGMLMDGHLTPFDMESWDVKARANA